MSIEYKDEKIVANDDKGQTFSGNDEKPDDLAGVFSGDNDEEDMAWYEAEDSGGKFCVDNREKDYNSAAIDDKSEDFGGTDAYGERFADKDERGKNFAVKDDSKPAWFAGFDDMYEVFCR